MSSPPRTPPRANPPSIHRRHPSSLDMSQPTSPTLSMSPRQPFRRRRSSAYSSQPPLTPQLSREFEHSSPGGHYDGGADTGLGNLADELGEVWDDDELDEVDGDDVYGEGETLQDLDLDMERAGEDVNSLNGDAQHDAGTNGVNGTGEGPPRDSGVSLQSPRSSKGTLSPSAAVRTSRRQHQRQRSLYDGSDYGSNSDLEDHEGISAGLARQMAAIESLARRGLEENGSANDNVVKRVVESLKDLGSQVVIESGATRLKTAHDALATHLTHQSRMLTSLTASLTGPRAIYPDPETISTLQPLITSTLELLPHASPEPLYALTQLTSSTRDLLQHLSSISDSLHMSRTAHNDASRRLRVAKEQVADWKRESVAREEGIKFVEQGEWGRRLGEREVGRECRDVVDGFEEVCGMWRQRLVEGLGEVAA